MMLHVISLGAGVQSTTMALMAAHGEITPMPDCAIFADTGAEPKAVYDHLEWLMSPNVLPFPVHIVSAGNLRDEIIAASQGHNGNYGRPPFFVRNRRNGRKGMLRRQCTQDYKIDPIHRKVRDLLGLKPRQRWPKVVSVEQWIGISSDEAQRMKNARVATIQNRWPLIEKRMSRQHCLQWLASHDYPMPPKSACTFCPYRKNALWRHLKDTDPAGWNDACAVDRAIRTDGYRHIVGEAFLHPTLKPLDEVDLSTDEERGQGNFWGFDQECEGMCGV